MTLRAEPGSGRNILSNWFSMRSLSDDVLRTAVEELTSALVAQMPNLKNRYGFPACDVQSSS